MWTYIFDIRATIDSDNIAMLNTQVVANDSVNPGTAIIEFIVRKNDQDRVLPLLASNDNSIAPEELKLVHSVI